MTKIEVTQADRDAPASAYFAWISNNPVIPNKMLSGQADDHSMVQAFARHRIAATAEKDAEIARLKSAVINLICALEMENPLPWRGTINEAENALGETK